MIAKILKSAGSAAAPIGYNESKVEEGVASVLAVYNMESATKLSIYESLTERQPRKALKKNSFHMTFSPADEEKIPDEDMLAVIGRMMQTLGYGEQPFVIYKHKDTVHTHYHVVSTRIKKDGYVVDATNERYIANNLLKKLAKEYGFIVGNDKKKKNNAPFVDMLHPVTMDEGDKGKQIEGAIKEALGYNFTTQFQFRQLLAMMNVEMAEVNTYGYKNLKFFTLDPQGHRNSVMFDTQFDKDYFTVLADRLAENTKTHPRLKKEKDRAANIIKSCFTYARSEEQFRLMLNNKGIAFIPSVNDKGEVYGGTFVDTTTKVCYKASEFAGSFRIAEYRSRCESGSWPGELRDTRARTEAPVITKTEAALAGTLVSLVLLNSQRAPIASAQSEGNELRGALNNISRVLKGGAGKAGGGGGGGAMPQDGKRGKEGEVKGEDEKHYIEFMGQKIKID